jgi:putative restriction endonuclease
VIAKLYDLNVGVVGQGSERHERPHKPVLLLAAMDLIAQGKDKPEHIRWSQELRGTFKQYFEQVRGRDDSDTPENPFLYLRGDGIWQPYCKGNGAAAALDHTPTVSEAKDDQVYAAMDGGLEFVASVPTSRAQIRDALISRYFPQARGQLKELFQKADPLAYAGIIPSSSELDTQALVGRNSAFRRKVLEVYDWQCAACGLRIKLPDSQLTFVDGAHLVPFSVSRNDHPTNGIALCKNHHWAMDRFLIVPTVGCRWKVSPYLDHRRSLGEQQLCALNGQPVLPPHDDAYRPSEEALSWRMERIFLG